jgi:hypothetical protein
VLLLPLVCVARIKGRIYMQISVYYTIARHCPTRGSFLCNCSHLRHRRRRRAATVETMCIILRLFFRRRDEDDAHNAPAN